MPQDKIGASGKEKAGQGWEKREGTGEDGG